jgi:hypothetical protein
MHAHDSHRQTVLSTPVVTVSQCPCGHVHVDLGAVTVRFDHASFEHVAHALVAALDRMREQQAMASKRAEA